MTHYCQNQKESHIILIPDYGIYHNLTVKKKTKNYFDNPIPLDAICLLIQTNVMNILLLYF